MRVNQTGLSLIELMISITVSMILSLAALTLYASQVRTFSVSDKRESAEQETRNTLNQLANLLRQAIVCTSAQCSPITPLSISYGSGARHTGNTLRTTNKNVVIDLLLPKNYAIWPNDAAPYGNNAVRIDWSEANGTIQVSSAASLAALPTASAVVIAGSAKAPIINLDLWPIKADGVTPQTGTLCDGANTDCPYGGYELSLTTRIGNVDSTYINPLDTANTQGLKNYRTVSYTTRIFPRN